MSGSITFDMMPAEVMKPIIGFLNIPKDVSACCSVCRKWLLIAQPLLFREIVLKTDKQMDLLLKSLQKSRRLQGYVVGVDFDIPHGHPISIRRQPRWSTVIRCLKRMRCLERLSLRGLGLADSLVEEICALTHLKWLTVDQRPVDLRAAVPDWRLWLELPPMVQHLELHGPSERLIQLLPRICQNLSSGQAEGLSDHMGSPWNTRLLIGTAPLNETQHGLRSLHLSAESASLEPEEWATVFKSLTRSLSGTLTCLIFSTARETKSELFGHFLSGLPQLQTLVLKMFKAEPGLFEGSLMGHPLRHLSSLTLTYLDAVYFEEGFPNFFQVLIDFLKHSPVVTSLAINFERYDTACLSDEFIYQLILATSIIHDTHLTTRLRLLKIHWARLSIEALEHLCHSAPILNHLAIDLPSGDIPRIGQALGRLPCLNHLKLGNSLRRKFFDGDATELVKYTASTLNDFTVGSKYLKIDRFACEMDPSGLMRIRLKGLGFLP